MSRQQEIIDIVEDVLGDEGDFIVRSLSVHTNQGQKHAWMIMSFLPFDWLELFELTRYIPHNLEIDSAVCTEQGEHHGYCALTISWLE